MTTVNDILNQALKSLTPPSIEEEDELETLVTTASNTLRSIKYVDANISDSYESLERQKGTAYYDAIESYYTNRIANFGERKEELVDKYVSTLHKINALTIKKYSHKFL